MSPVADHDPRGAGAGFAAALRARRQARGLTQEDLATRAGLGVRTLRELEPSSGPPRPRSRAATATAEVGDPTHRVRALGTLGQAFAEAGRLPEAAGVLVELAELPGSAGMSSMISGYLALARQDRPAAADAFETAANLLAGRDDIRDVLEALAGLVASAAPEDRIRALGELDRIRARGRLVLLPREQALLSTG